MRIILLLFLLIRVPLYFGVAQAKIHTQPSQTECGGQNRWAVKTMTDPDAKKVKLTAIKSSVTELSKIKPAQKVGNNTPRFGEEFKTYEVVCRIPEYFREDDGDFHLVLADTSNASITIVGEIPDPLCKSVAQSPQINKISTARLYFMDNVKGKNGKCKPGLYKVKGVVFFDKPHGQNGASDNGIELHPILSIKKI